MLLAASGAQHYGNVKITATSGGATISGNNVTLEAAQNTTTQTRSSSGSKQTLGASYSVGAQHGFTIGIGASQSRGKGDVGGNLNVYNPMIPPSFFVIITVAERGRATAPPGP